MLSSPTQRYLAVSVVLISFLIVVLCIGRQGPWVEVVDYGEHAASVLEMSENLFSPQNPLLPLSGDTTLRYTPYIFIAGLIKKVLHLELETTLAFISVLSFVILIIGVYLFSVQYFGNRDMPLYLFIVLLFFWGRPFIYSNDYSFGFLVYTLFYPSIVAFNLSFIGFYLLLVLLKKPDIKQILLYIVLSAFLFQTHPLTASFYYLACFLIVVTEKGTIKKGLVVLTAAGAFSLITAFLWPYYPFLQAFNKSMTTEWYQQDFKSCLYDPLNILLSAGPALLGLPLVFRLLLTRQRLFIPLGFFACLIIYILSLLLDINLGERYIFFIVFFLHLAVADYMCQMKLLSVKTWQTIFKLPFLRSAAIVVFALLLAGGILVHTGNPVLQQSGYSLQMAPPFVYRYSDPLEKYRGLRPHLQKGDIVLSDPLSMWLLPALTGARIVALYHDNPLVPDNNERIRDVLDFYHPETSKETRLSIMGKHNISHLLLNLNRGDKHLFTHEAVSMLYSTDFKIDNKLINDLSQTGQIVYEGHGLMLLRLKQPVKNR